MSSAPTENGFEKVNSVSKEPIMNGPSTVPLANHVPSVNHVSNNISQGKMDKSKEHKSHHSSSSKHGEHKHRGDDHKHHSSSSSKHKSSSDSSKHKHHSSSSKDRHHHSKHKDGSSSSSSQKHKDGASSSSHKHKDGSCSSSSHKHKDGSGSGSSHKHKDGSSSGSSHKHGSGSSSSHKHKDGSSSSSHKHKDGSSGSSHKSKDGRPKEHSSSHSSSNKVKEQSHKLDGQSSISSSSKSEVHSSSKHKSESSSPPKLPAVPPLTIKVKSESVSPVKVKSETVSPPKHNSESVHHNKLKLKKQPISDDDDDDVPLSVRQEITVKSEPKMEIPEKAPKRPADDSDDEPLSARVENVKKIKKEQVPNKKRKSLEDDSYAPKKKKIKHNKAVKEESSPKKGKKQKKEDTSTVWKWWEEEKKTDGSKWSTLTHKGPVFAPPYEPLPDSVKFHYDGKEMRLSENAEEVATFYGKMLEHDYTTKEIFNKNFFKDWRKTMTEKERGIITNLSKCNFRQICDYFKMKTEERKNWTKDQKNQLKEENARLVEEYGFCIIDGHKQKIGNFRIEPPGLFRGRGDHPKQGMHKKRTLPEDVIINCGKGSEIPKAPAGHKWKEVRHDNSVTWLSSWNENIQGSTKYVMLNAASKLKGEKDWQKYETARKLHAIVDKIRMNYRSDFKSKEMRIRQRAAALYFIDKLALRAGNEKDDDQADTVGCCSLRTEHIKLHEEYEGEPYVVEFDFLGKDSIRYYNRVSIDKRVFRNLQLFQENKAPGDDLFDRLNTTILNKHLQSLMDGLTAKVFRTYNASKTLQEQLDKLTVEDDPIPAKLLSYNRANRAVAVLCNHQRAAPKNFSQQMERLQEKIDAKKDAIKQAKKDVKDAKVDVRQLKTEAAKKLLDRKKKALARLEDQLTKLEVQATDKDENKEIALGTSKLNYLDPRISVAWCKKWEVPVEKVYNKTQREKFAWAIEMVDEDYKFFDEDGTNE